MTWANNWLLLKACLKIHVFKAASKAADEHFGQLFDFLQGIFYPDIFLTHIILRMFSIMFIRVSFIGIFLLGMKR